MSEPSRTSPERTDGEEPQPSQSLNRALYLLILGSFFLPFVTVSSCEGEAGRSYTGIELVQDELGLLLVGVMAAAGVLFVASFRHRILTPQRISLVQASKALLCALAILTTWFAAGMTFMFNRVEGHVGIHLCCASWLILYLGSMWTAIRHGSVERGKCKERPPSWGFRVGFLLLVIYWITVWYSEPSGFGEVNLGFLASLFLSAPLILLAELAAVRYRLSNSGV